MRKPAAYYNLDDLYKSGDLLYDKLNDQVFIYDRFKHIENLKKAPNNYRKAHRGDHTYTPCANLLVTQKYKKYVEWIYNRYIKPRLDKKDKK